MKNPHVSMPADFETHGRAVAIAALCFVILSPLFAFTICVLAAWLMN